jgi:tetratricopeptide (TPR) repeat protein
MLKPSEILNIRTDRRRHLRQAAAALAGEDRSATKRFAGSGISALPAGPLRWNRGATVRKRVSSSSARRQDHALAYTGLADSYLALGSYLVETIPEAKAAAERAIALDGSLAEAHVALGHIKLWLDWDWPAAEREFTQGITLNPASALAHTEYAIYLATLGRGPEAMAEATRARDLDPQPSGRLVAEIEVAESRSAASDTGRPAVPATRVSGCAVLPAPVRSCGTATAVAAPAMRISVTMVGSDANEQAI